LELAEVCHAEFAEQSVGLEWRGKMSVLSLLWENVVSRGIGVTMVAGLTKSGVWKERGWWWMERKREREGEGGGGSLTSVCQLR